MKLLNFVIILTGFTTMSLSSAVSHNMLQDCTKLNIGLTACGMPGGSQEKEVFQCTPLDWTWVGTCFDPKFPCVNGACTLLPIGIEGRESECNEGQKRCLTAYDHGHDGIQICKNGKWELLDPCRCDTDPIRCKPIGTRDITEPHRCTEDEPKCMLQNKNGNGGTLFRCKNGFWKAEMRCRPSERCHDSPNFSTCSWRDAAAIAKGEDTTDNQVRSGNEPTIDYTSDHTA